MADASWDGGTLAKDKRCVFMCIHLRKDCVCFCALCGVHLSLHLRMYLCLCTVLCVPVSVLVCSPVCACICACV